MNILAICNGSLFMPQRLFKYFKYDKFSKLLNTIDVENEPNSYVVLNFILSGQLIRKKRT